jgi:hypothetical protein
MNIDISDINKKHEELRESFFQTFQGRSQYQISNFVVGAHCSLERQFDQCVLELQMKYYHIKRADITRRKLLKEIAEDVDPFVKEEKELDLEQLEIMIIGAIREFNHLYKIYQSMPKFTIEQLQEAESKYWLERITTQAQIEIDAHGTIGTGNAEVLRQMDLINGDSRRFFENIKNHPGVNEIVKDIANQIEATK